MDIVSKQLVGSEEDTDVAHRAQVHKLVQLVLHIALMDEVHVQALYEEWEWDYIISLHGEWEWHTWVHKSTNWCSLCSTALVDEVHTYRRCMGNGNT